ncbi:MAG TPA: hypothetical protein VGH36_14185 [Acetobacteraceae bacterium]|jgi:hypothetical protein
MARIAKSEHATIQRLVEVERKKVPEIAAEYGCTPANIYAILTRLRCPGPAAANDPTPVVEAEVETVANAVTEEMPEEATPPTLQAPFELVVANGPGRKGRAPRDGQKRRAAPEQAPAPEPAPLLEVAEATPAPAPIPPAPPAAIPLAAKPPAETVTPAVRNASRNAAAPKARLKSGYGLCTRSPEGDDSITPFRSLEDLLSAVKPILRASANAPEPVWFSIQPMDLADIDLETL